MESIKLIRGKDNGINTPGRLYVFDDNDKCLFECFTLELSWRNNEKNISHIPSGIYNVKKIKRASNNKDAFWLQNVAHRAEILIHVGNFASSDPRFKSDIQGCILVGMELKDINKDRVVDLLNSQVALNEMLKFLSENSIIEII